MADETSADGSCQMLNPSYAKWLDMSADWLHRIFGQLQFTDKSTSKMAGILAEMGIAMPGMGNIGHG